MQCTGVKNIISLTKAEYDALANKDSETIYVVENYHDYVDLGLRDGNGQKILFATCNIGASAPQEYGDYFAWGETSKRYTSIENDSVVGGSFTWANCPYHTGSAGGTGWSKYIPTGMESYTVSGVADNKLTLEAGDDIASVLWEGNWRMPDNSDLKYLIGSNVTCTWTDNYNGTGVRGLIVTGKDSFSSASLFLPAAGNCGGTHLESPGSSGSYWSRSLFTFEPYSALYFSFWSDIQYTLDGSRSVGRSVRPVHVGDVVPTYKVYKGTALLTIDVNQLVTKTDLSTKQDALVSGTNIKTVNGNSILGSGNLDIINIATTAEIDALFDGGGGGGSGSGSGH